MELNTHSPDWVRKNSSISFATLPKRAYIRQSGVWEGGQHTHHFKFTTFLRDTIFLLITSTI